jgi:translation initiation factor 5B
LKRRRDNEHLAVFPCRLRVLPQHIFNARNPIVVGVNVEAGKLKKGTPIVAKTDDDASQFFCVYYNFTLF